MSCCSDASQPTPSRALARASADVRPSSDSACSSHLLPSPWYPLARQNHRNAPLSLRASSVPSCCRALLPVVQTTPYPLTPTTSARLLPPGLGSIRRGHASWLGPLRSPRA